jgi:hypothetical protein
METGISAAALRRDPRNQGTIMRWEFYEAEKAQLA